MEMRTPPPFSDERNESRLRQATKDYKKRKSWGQVLPEPKTNLPPRKRAKTEDEKEQRRVERVLRNRRAAQSSRERKRQEVEALEQRNKELEARVLSIEKTNLLLLEELNKYRRTTGVVTRSSSTLDALPSNPVTLTSELFGSQGSHKTLMDRIIFAETSHSTVDPSSLSPKAATQNMDQLSPDPETSRTAAVTDERMSMTQTRTPSTELTQRPAAMLCDLQCQQSVDPQSWTTSQMSPVQLQTQFLILSTLVSTCQRPLTQIAMSLKAGFSSPNSIDFENDYMASDSSTLFPTDPFDLSQFLHEDAEAELGLHFTDFETHFSPENLNLQPHTGASTQGCDDGGLAVGV
ncbi:unnamed protein product [Parascedosporium putredinis]|uniref:BZIP domain-containing protein n=1 Tax=Parascedosporium putredinis TaxID=1442378 RepID=A0A9P1H0B9_9PEZI|nr:unnamed protein product [Parascedosporium putredinis]CAI7993735.1 unnamed protein product [Parascedosporium putredinis]